MDIDKIIDFLQTDTLSVTFTENGLSYLSLKFNDGKENINLKEIIEKDDKTSKEYLLIEETWNFLETGKHNMKLDLRGYTEFQKSVFRAVSKVNVGSVCTYKDIATMIGKPGAAQAVGTSISKNPVSYFIPNHRVIPKRGLAICKTGAGFLRNKLLALEGNDVEKLKGNYVCGRKKCCLDLGN